MRATGGSDCPACGAHIDSKLVHLEAFDVALCARCGFRWTTSEMREHYESQRYAGFREDLVFARNIRIELRERIAQFCPPPARVLDIGCGSGAFLEAAATEGYEVLGADISAAAVDLCRKRGLPAVPLGGSDLGTHDLVTMWDVIEHSTSPHDLIDLARNALRPGGWLVVKTPNIPESVFRAATRVPRLQRLLLQTPAHVCFFTRNSLSMLLARGGFTDLHWLPGRRLRGRRPLRSARTIASETVRFTMKRVAGPHNLYLLAR